MSLGRLRKLFAVFDADVVVYVRWRAGDLDRLIDSRHASLAERVTQLLELAGWIVAPEVSFSVFGERGSIDLLAWHPATRTLLVIELKSELTSIEATLRQHDVKVRLGPDIARERFGWDAAAVARLLVLPDDRTSRRRVEHHRAVFARAYPQRNVAVRHWLKLPVGALGGILFLSDAMAARSKRRVRRIRGAPPGP